MTKPHCDNCNLVGMCPHEDEVRAAMIRPRCHHHEFKPKPIVIRRTQAGIYFSPNINYEQKELAL